MSAEDIQKLPGMNDHLNYGVLEDKGKRNNFDINKVDYQWVQNNSNVRELK